MFQSKYEKFLEKEIERLRTELGEKDRQIENLQAALVAKEAPEAYVDRYARPPTLSPEQAEQMRRLSAESQLLTRYSQLIEEPLFSDDAAIDALQRVIGPPRFDKPIADNSES